MKRLASVVLAAVVLFSGIGVAEAAPLRVYVNGDEQMYDQPPVLINGRTMVPMRGIFETLGATIQWDAATGTVTAIKSMNTVKLQIGSINAFMNGKKIVLDQAPVVINNRTMVPVRFVGESLGADVTWDGYYNRVSITPIEEKLLRAVLLSHYDEMKALVERGANIKYHDKSDRTALFFADVDSAEFTKYLLENGLADEINHKGPTDQTALMRAVADRQVHTWGKRSSYGMEVINLLLTHKADPNIGDWVGDTPLLRSVFHNDFDCAEMLLKAGADPNQKNNYGLSPLQEADGNEEMIALLKKYGAKK